MAKAGFEPEGKVKAIRQTENGKIVTIWGTGSHQFYDPDDLENRTEIISAFEWNGSRIKRM
jgi:hypothetical protein